MPVAITIPAPSIKLDEGVADQKIQSMAKAPRMDVYSNGATTAGGARRKASVIQNWPSAPAKPCLASHGQSDAGISRQLPIESSPEPMPTSIKFQNTVDMIELPRPSDLTVNALS